MNPGRSAWRALDNLIDRALCVGGAVLVSQAPEFMQQYLQRLGGHLDESRRQLDQFRQSATQAGLTLEQLIHQTAATADPVVAQLSDVMAGAQARTETLQAAYDTLGQASLWARPFVFLRHLDAGIARATWTAFRPAVPTTVEGLIYAAVGMLLLLGVYHLGVKRAARRFRPGRRLKPATAR